MIDDDENFMREALGEAKKAFALGEVPVGAVLVLGGEVIGRSHNGVERANDASHHAELLCLQQAARAHGNWRLLESTLYCSLEPCAMCAGALALFRVKRVVYAAPDLRHGACGTVFDVLNRPHPIHTVVVEGGVLAGESKELLQRFFKERRGCEKSYSQK